MPHFVLRFASGFRLLIPLCLVVAVALFSDGCFESEDGKEFYAQVLTPSAQEFRWSDGGLPQVFDPARAAAPPDTDAVRALFEGLTDYEPGTLKPSPAVATRWESVDQGRQWTFYLRADARWSNGDPVTAGDFVRSWRRALRLGERAPHADLLDNIEGAQEYTASLLVNRHQRDEEAMPLASATQGITESNRPELPGAPIAHEQNTPSKFGAEALDEHTLRITLRRPDENFPALAAHPVFRPTHELTPVEDFQAVQDEKGNPASSDAAQSIITNGAFSLTDLNSKGVLLERAKYYWGADSVKLERVRFVAHKSAEDALAAYSTGDVDAVSNAAFEPLVVKLLTTFRDFRRDTFGALTFYSFNTSRRPFNDVRVRAAFALALDLDRLSADTLEGATEPAKKFLPVQKKSVGNAGREEAVEETENVVGNEARGEDTVAPLQHNAERARRLLAEAGFPNGENFPHVRLLVNRNEPQRQVAQAVARMWRNTLGVQTDLLIRSWEEYESLMKTGDYDVARRGIVLQSTDEASNMLAMFGEDAGSTTRDTDVAASPQIAPSLTPSQNGQGITTNNQTPATPLRTSILSEADALRELPAIPIYFASSYAMVKPYVVGFDSNLLDAPSLKNVSINTEWRTPASKDGVKIMWGEIR